jgi:hypothetical protein
MHGPFSARTQSAQGRRSRRRGDVRLVLAAQPRAGSRGFKVAAGSRDRKSSQKGCDARGAAASREPRIQASISPSISEAWADVRGWFSPFNGDYRSPCSGETQGIRMNWHRPVMATTHRAVDKPSQDPCARLSQGDPTRPRTQVILRCMHRGLFHSTLSTRRGTRVSSNSIYASHQQGPHAPSTARRSVTSTVPSLFVSV